MSGGIEPREITLSRAGFLRRSFSGRSAHVLLVRAEPPAYKQQPEL